MAGRDLTRIDHILIGCSASPDGRWFTVADVDRWDAERGVRRSLGIAPTFNPALRSIGWHFVVGVNGALWTGRSYHEPGGHATRLNTQSMQVCLLGSSKYTPEAWQTLQTNVCAMLKTLGQAHGAKGPFNRPTPREALQLAHELKITIGECSGGPGFDIEDWLLHDMAALAGHIHQDEPPPAARRAAA